MLFLVDPTDISSVNKFCMLESKMELIEAEIKKQLAFSGYKFHLDSSTFGQTVNLNKKVVKNEDQTK